MKKINISICTQQNCYIKGATLFKQLDSIMGASIKSKTNLTGTACPGYCKKMGASQAPCVTVNNRIIPQAQPAEILRATRELIAV